MEFPDWRTFLEAGSGLLVLAFGVVVFRYDRLVSMLLISAALLSGVLVWSRMPLIKFFILENQGSRSVLRQLLYLVWSISWIGPWLLVLTAVFIRRGPGKGSE